MKTTPDQPEFRVLSRFRRFTRHAWLLHAWLIAYLILMPVSRSHAEWITVYDGNGNLWYDLDDINDSGTWDTGETQVFHDFWVPIFHSVLTTAEIGRFNDTSRNGSRESEETQEIFSNDYDSLYDWEEFDIGTDPHNSDSDYDGIDDGTEWLIVKPFIESLPSESGFGYVVSPLDWDSNDDNISDYDAYYLASHPGSAYQPPVFTGGVLPGFPNAKFYDYDGDGWFNPDDSYPMDPTNNDADGDTILDFNDYPANTVPYDPVLHNPVLPTDYENLSPHNSGSPNWGNTGKWYTSAMGDLDGDGVKNWYDLYPDQGITDDADGDLIVDLIDGVPNDPVPGNPENPKLHEAPAATIHWRKDALGDVDTDGVKNWYDTHPYDKWDGTGTSDNDGDNIQNSLDPFPEDETNFSSVNGIAWWGSLFEDSDGDSQQNFSDPYPGDRYNGDPDFDDDGNPNESDPYPEDATNTSAVNGIAWNGNLFGDEDGDTNPNWCDAYPYDAFDGNPNVDGDEFLNLADPAPWDATNYSAENGIAWGALARGDADGDTTLNFYDSYPYPVSQVDTDGDGIFDDLDPYDNDPNNYSGTNDTNWYGSVNGDNDSDSNPNWNDAWPYDQYDGNPDFDSDGIGNADDPLPRNGNNPSPYNGQNWPSTSALENTDGDYLINWWDPQPSISNIHPDLDLDGILNASDPYPEDATNYSSVNATNWYGNVLGDTDGDGTLNHADVWPSDSHNGQDLVDDDADGLTLWEENQYGTSDGDPDWDDDTLTDFEELVTYGTGPKNKYSKGEALGWGQLYEDWQLVDLSDSDIDGIPNRIEQHYAGMNPEDASDATGDLDSNGLTNLEQYNRGWALNAELGNYDTDQDGMTNLWEDYYGFDKHDPLDAVGDRDGDRVLNWEEHLLRLNPNTGYSPGTGAFGDREKWFEQVLPWADRMDTGDVNENSIPDWLDAAEANPAYSPASPTDWDNDGLPNWWEHKYGSRNFPNGVNLRHPDADGDNEVGGGDGVSNAQEFELGTHPMISDTDGNGISDGLEDWDGDGMNTIAELAAGTNTRLLDTDGDGVSDAQEIAEGSDPLSSSSSSASAIGLRVFTPLPPLPAGAP